MQVIAHQNETLDALCWRVLGRTDCLEAVLKDNADCLNRVFLAQGQKVTLPTRVDDEEKPKNSIKLWD